MRIVPLTGTNAQRAVYASLGLLKENELHATKDQLRLFLSNNIVSGVWHGSVASEAAMLALHSTVARGCWTLDMCKRTDLPGTPVMACTGNNGKTVGDWQRLGFSTEVATQAESVEYDNTSSELTATDVQAAIDELVDTAVIDPTTSQGDLIYRGGDGLLHRLPVGSVGQVLKLVVDGLGLSPTWQAETGGGGSGSTDIRDVWLFS